MKSFATITLTFVAIIIGTEFVDAVVYDLNQVHGSKLTHKGKLNNVTGKIRIPMVLLDLYHEVFIYLLLLTSHLAKRLGVMHNITFLPTFDYIILRFHCLTPVLLALPP